MDAAMHRLRLLAFAAISLGLAACTGSGGSPGGTPILVGFVPGSGNLVQVTAEDIWPADRVELVGPAGQVYAASEVSTSPLTYRQDRYGYTRGYLPGYYDTPRKVGVGAFGAATGHTGGVLGGRDYGVYDTVERQRAVKSMARIAVADMAAYKATWQDWRTRIRFRDSLGATRTVEIEAPPPPMPTVTGAGAAAAE
jgi:hypothetical protein